MRDLEFELRLGLFMPSYSGVYMRSITGFMKKKVAGSRQRFVASMSMLQASASEAF